MHSLFFWLKVPRIICIFERLILAVCYDPVKKILVLKVCDINITSLISKVSLSNFLGTTIVSVSAAAPTEYEEDQFCTHCLRGMLILYP